MHYVVVADVNINSKWPRLHYTLSASSESSLFILHPHLEIPTIKYNYLLLLVHPRLQQVVDSPYLN